MKEQSKPIENWILRLFSSWIIISLFFGYKNIEIIRELRLVSSVGTIKWVGLIILVFELITLLKILLKKWYIDIIVAFISLQLYLSLVVYELTDIYLCIILLLVMGVFIFYIVGRYPIFIKNLKLNNKATLIIFTIMFAISLVYIGTLSLSRYLVLKSPNFDFGIFSQMFYYMDKTFMPLVTCERDVLMSHFNVHVSPIFYLILPIYKLFPSPATLLVMQAIIVISGAIPLYLLCKHKKLPNLITTCLCIVYLSYPSLLGGFFYDFHENKFLAPLILWLVYFIEKEKTLWTIFFAILTLFVKEDAAVYVACIALYMLFSKKTLKEKIKAGGILVGSVIYFMIVIKYLETYGDGAMSTRFDEFLINPDDSLFTIILNILKNPAYFATQLLTEDKIKFLCWTMLPLAFIPFRVKDIKTYILLIPYILMHFMSSYVYQHNIYFQYTYGSTVLLFYVTVLFFEGKDTVKKRGLALFMCAAGIVLCISAITPKHYYYEDAKENMETYDYIREVLRTQIPKDASVAGSAYYIPPISDRDKIYKFETKQHVEYIVYDLRIAADRAKISADQTIRLANGYVIHYDDEKYVRILKYVGEE